LLRRAGVAKERRLTAAFQEPGGNCHALAVDAVPACFGAEPGEWPAGTGPHDDGRKAAPGQPAEHGIHPLALGARNRNRSWSPVPIRPFQQRLSIGSSRMRSRPSGQTDLAIPGATIEHLHREMKLAESGIMER
jgi:hypothetical protein